MQTKLLQLKKRVDDLEIMADEVLTLAEKMINGEDVQPTLSVQGQRWYRGAHEVLVQHKFSGIDEFEHCYNSSFTRRGGGGGRDFSDIEQYINRGTSDWRKITKTERDHFDLFKVHFVKARALLLSVVDEISSSELPIVTQLSFTVANSEFITAQELLDQCNKDESLIRAAGVIGRVALERHLWTLVETRSIEVVVNPPSKKKPDMEDVTTTLVKSSVITPIQKSQLDNLFKIGNNCAHPKEVVGFDDVQRLLREGLQLAAVIT